ncbi:WxL domain-containing protein [Lacticaseibacillus hulanensis]|uniref:WxL domain-containing protein n=1 Tax=Lacticaseibacillus hulanensis TaxID=2493111 RepID=UPI000FD83DA3|nr:WxL domain-containing protein [Lacticaseibacillus hulanensis]
MKKQLFLAAAFASAFALAGLNQVSADTTTGKSVNSTATFNIDNSGDKGSDGSTLYLQSAPSFTFGNADMVDVITTGAKLNDAKIDGPLVVKDFTGDSKGWSVTAKMSPFNNGDDAINGTLAFTPTLNTDKTASNNLTTDTADLPATATLASDGTASSQVAGAKIGSGQGTSTINATGATLNFNADPTAKAGTYTADITWTVTGGAPVASQSGTTLTK